jgi:hypothetical protein
MTQQTAADYAGAPGFHFVITRLVRVIHKDSQKPTLAAITGDSLPLVIMDGPDSRSRYARPGPGHDEREGGNQLSAHCRSRL